MRERERERENGREWKRMGENGRDWQRARERQNLKPPSWFSVAAAGNYNCNISADM